MVIAFCLRSAYTITDHKTGPESEGEPHPEGETKGEPEPEPKEEAEPYSEPEGEPEVVGEPYGCAFRDYSVCNEMHVRSVARHGLHGHLRR